MTLLGDYEKAGALFREIIRSGQEARQQFENWRAKYVFDTLAAGRSWHAPNREPTGAAFLPMIEVEETYRDLLTKTKRVIADDFTAHGARMGPLRRPRLHLGAHCVWQKGRSGARHAALRW